MSYKLSKLKFVSKKSAAAFSPSGLEWLEKPKQTMTVFFQGAGGKFSAGTLIFSPNALYTITTKPCKVTLLNSNVTDYRHGLLKKTKEKLS